MDLVLRIGWALHVAGNDPLAINADDVLELNAEAVELRRQGNSPRLETGALGHRHECLAGGAARAVALVRADDDGQPPVEQDPLGECPALVRHHTAPRPGGAAVARVHEPRIEVVERVLGEDARDDGLVPGGNRSKTDLRSAACQLPADEGPVVAGRQRGSRCRRGARCAGLGTLRSRERAREATSPMAARSACRMTTRRRSRHLTSSRPAGSRRRPAGWPCA